LIYKAHSLLVHKSPRAQAKADGSSRQNARSPLAPNPSLKPLCSLIGGESHRVLRFFPHHWLPYNFSRVASTSDPYGPSIFRALIAFLYPGRATYILPVVSAIRPPSDRLRIPRTPGHNLSAFFFPSHVPAFSTPFPNFPLLTASSSQRFTPLLPPFVEVLLIGPKCGLNCPVRLFFCPYTNHLPPFC